MRAKFRVQWPRPLDGANAATVIIDRARGLFAVRPLRRRREYVLPLATVAEWCVWSVARVELREKVKAKKAARAARREA